MPAADQVGSPASHLSELFWRLKSKRIRVAPCHTNRASSIGNECARALFYERTANEMRTVHDADTQALFDLGEHLEKFVVREIEEMGIEVVERQRDYHDKRFNITGHVDGKLVVPGFPRPLPLEIKGLNPYTAESIETVEDIRNSKSAWVRKYYAQLQQYLYLDEIDLGVFALLNKVSGRIRFVDCPLDYAFAESLLKKVEVVNAAVAAGAPPDRRVTSDCERCPFVHLCGPDRSFGPGVEVVSDPELEAALKRRADLHLAAKEFERLDKQIKGALKGKREALVGEFVVTGKEVERKGFEVKPSKFWQVDIRPLVKP